MRYIPRSSYGPKASGPMYYIPGGFCLPAQPSAPDHDVVSDLVAGGGTLARSIEVKGGSTSSLPVIQRLFHTLVEIMRGRKVEISSNAGPGDGTALVQ